MALVTTDLALRFESDSGLADNGSYVTSWTDQVDSHVLSQTGQPPLSTDLTPTGEDAVDFLGGSDKLDRGNTAVPNMPGADDARTMFMVWKNNGTGRGGFEYGIQSAGRSFGLGMDANEDFTILSWNNDEASATTAVGAGWVVQSVRYDGSGGWVHYIDGVQIGSGTGQSYDTNIAGSSDMRMGVEISNGNNVACEIAAVLCYDSELSTADHTEVVDYLTAKYISATTTVDIAASLTAELTATAAADRAAVIASTLTAGLTTVSTASVDVPTVDIAASLSAELTTGSTALRVVPVAASIGAGLTATSTALRVVPVASALAAGLSTLSTATRTATIAAALDAELTVLSSAAVGALPVSISATLSAELTAISTASRAATVASTLTAELTTTSTVVKAVSIASALSAGLTATSDASRAVPISSALSAGLTTISSADVPMATVALAAALAAELTATSDATRLAVIAASLAAGLTVTSTATGGSEIPAGFEVENVRTTLEVVEVGLSVEVSTFRRVGSHG